MFCSEDPEDRQVCLGSPARSRCTSTLLHLGFCAMTRPRLESRHPPPEQQAQSANEQSRDDGGVIWHEDLAHQNLIGSSVETCPTLL